MENIYLAIVIILFLLAASDLIVGVGNDAVNFLNSAIGSKVAPFRVIMIIAALGVFIGSTFSMGMMDVAKKGLFNPEAFTFQEVMVIFLAVMITDILLLDLFNTFGIPTSTTVSIVFEILGSAVAIGAMKISHNNEATGNLGSFINSGGVLTIVSGILLSVIIAFTFGMIIQFLSRIIFTFNYKKTIRNFGAIWGGLAITAITFFILIKGAKGSAFLSKENIDWITNNSSLILLICFGGWTIIIQLLLWLFKTNVFKVVVLFGTFALAMAFAGNDLVNFIGVPLAGYQSFKIFIQNGAISDSFSMIALKESVKSEPIFLIIAGLIMVLTLWFSRKARSVVRTSLNLSKQDEVNERFTSSVFARTLVRLWLQAGNGIKKIIPKRLLKWINGRLDDKHFKKQAKKDKELSFDLVRAAVNLAVSSSLIAYATSYKLPLSTTYVTFMAAMGTSLADKAWGRESAVYRISGVITIIGSWFFTAFVAFTAAFLLAIIMYFGGFIAAGGLIIIAIFIILRTHVLFIKREKAIKKADDDLFIDTTVNSEKVFEKCNLNVIKTLDDTSTIYKNIVDGLLNEKRKKLKKTLTEATELNKEVKTLKKNAHNTVKHFHEEELIETGDSYVQLLDYLRETAHSLEFIIQPIYEHINNNHNPLKKAEADDLKSFEIYFRDYILKTVKVISSYKYEDIEKLNLLMAELFDLLAKMRKSHLKRIKTDTQSTRLSMLYLDILSESKNLIIYTINVTKSSRDFYKSAQTKR